MPRLLAPALALTVFALATPIVAERAPADADMDAARRRAPSFSGLEPGTFVDHAQTVPIDIVLIGFDSDQINRKDLSALLPPTSTPAVRVPQAYGLNGRALGLDTTSSIR